MISGLRSKPLSQLVAGYMISILFQFHVFQETVLQFHVRIPSQHAVVNLNQVYVLNNERPVPCFRCEGGHYVKECPILMCRKCSGQHDFKDCTLPKENWCARNVASAVTLQKLVMDWSRRKSPRTFWSQQRGPAVCLHAVLEMQLPPL